MTSKEFVIWLKGFTEGVHDFNVTPKQWDNLKDTLNQVSDEPIRTSGYASINFLTGSSSTAVYPIPNPNTTITYTASTGSGWGINTTYSTSTDKNLLHD